MRRHLTYANVVATLALVVAVGGGSTAIAISAKKAPKNSVTTKSIRNGAVTTDKIRDGSVTASDLGPVRVEYFSSGQQNPTLSCRPGERLVSGGVLNTGGFTTSAPTIDGNGWRIGPGGTVAVLCLLGTSGR